jgi:nucleotide-binding universal stress UspA family protein
MKRERQTVARTREANLPRRIGLRIGTSRPGGRKGVSPTQVSPIIKLSRILVPVDFSRASIKPLGYASAMVKAHGAKIVLLHVTKPISFCADYGYGPVNRQVTDDAQVRRDRSRLTRSARKHLPPGSVEDVLIRSGDTSAQIIGAASEVEADLIVLYAHERNDSNALGSHKTAERVTRSAQCPVLVVRSHEHDFIQPPRKRS